MASIGFAPNTQEFMTIPFNQPSQASFVAPPQAKLTPDACGMAYDGGLMYCSPTVGECIYHKPGSTAWTLPSEMQPGFVVLQPACAIIGGKLWMSGGSPTLGTCIFKA